MSEAVTCAIPGAKNPIQTEENVSAANFPEIDETIMRAVEELYTSRIKPLVHQYW